jgi:selenoprotein W-related protein
VSLATELLKEFESQIELFEIVPSDGGRFEVSVNGELIFSKLALGRHAATGEIIQAVRDRLT